MTDFVIFPMRTISISQRYWKKHKAWDLNGEDTGIDYWYAPCKVKVLAIFEINKTGFYNTVLFGSCDDQGNPKAVKCADGKERILTFGCTHMDRLNVFGLKVGKIYNSGERCYMEGNTGISYGNHVHMDVAEGWHYRRSKRSGQWLLPKLVDISKIFYQLDDWNISRKLNGYAFPVVNSRYVETNEKYKYPDTVTGYAIFTNKLGLRVRDNVVSGKILKTVKKGNELKIRYFLEGFQSDKYQWAATEYQGIEGFSQIDTKNCYSVITSDQSVMVPNSDIKITPLKLYLNTQSRGAYIRSSVVNGEIIKKVPANKLIQVIELLEGFQSDGFQWCKSKYGKTEGYTQIDVKNWHTFETKQTK